MGTCDLRVIVLSCPEPESCILGSCPSCFPRIEESTSSEALSQTETHITSSADVEGLFLVETASSSRSNDVVIYSPHSRPRQTPALDPQCTQQPGFSQAPYPSEHQVSSQQFAPIGDALQQQQMQLGVEMSLSSAGKQVQSGRPAYQGQLASNLQFAVDPPYAVDHLVDRGQIMAGRKTEDKMSRKPLTDAEKIDIINRVRGEDGQGMPYRQSGQWREETV
ncbi:MAG: hypothetical protein J3Q66DRAFT_373517 [Benniella sp.]|nr:MAG: hypothetical protein J3Q66DRAFT_373517 [Benniella sp.]